MKIIRRVYWFTGFFLLVCLCVILLHVSTNTDEFSRYNLQWNGTSVFFRSLDATAPIEIRKLDLAQQDGVFLLIIAPERPFHEWECNEILDFLVRGNIVFLADESGTGNTLLEGIGSGIRVVPSNLSSIDRQYDDQSSVIAYPSAPDPINKGIDRLVLNKPSYVEGKTALFSTSLLSWVDEDGNGRIGETEKLGRYSILSRENIGNGTLYVLSDPSLFINGMQGISEGNSNFLGKFSTIDGFDLALEQDHSKTARADILVRGIVYVKGSKLMKTVIFILIGALASVIAWKRYTETSR